MPQATIVRITRTIRPGRSTEYFIESKEGDYRMRTNDGSRVEREFSGSETTVYLHAVVDSWSCTLGAQTTKADWDR